LQDAVKKNFVDDFDDEEWEISRNILNSDKF
jgi:ABC-type Fe3+-citrate transport system substrate-binding protein